MWRFCYILQAKKKSGGVRNIAYDVIVGGGFEPFRHWPLEPFLSEKLEDRVTNPNVLNGRKTREPASRYFSFRKTRGPGEKLGNRPLEPFLSEKLEDREKNSGTAISNLFFQKNQRINAVVECPDIRRDVSRPRIRHRPLDTFLSEKLEDRVTNPNVLNVRKTREPASRYFSFRKTRGPGGKLGNRSLEPFLSEKLEDRVAHPGLFGI